MEKSKQQQHTEIKYDEIKQFSLAQ